MDRQQVGTYDGGEERVVMSARIEKLDGGMGSGAARAFAANERMNQLLIEALNPVVWTAKPVGGVRTIAAIFTHMHNVRCKWIRLTAPHMKVPARLSRSRCTPEEARAGLAKSGAGCVEMLAEAMDGGGRLTEFLRDGLAQAWPVGPEMLCYMVAHEAHHRGQICMLAHQFGYPVAGNVTGAMWNWERAWRE